MQPQRPKDYSSLTVGEIHAKHDAVAKGLAARELVGGDLAAHLIRLANIARRKKIAT